MKKLVAEHGAVVGTVAAAGEFSNYGGGIFAGCTSSALESDQKVVKLFPLIGQDFRIRNVYSKVAHVSTSFWFNCNKGEVVNFHSIIKKSRNSYFHSIEIVRKSISICAYSFIYLLCQLKLLSLFFFKLTCNNFPSSLSSPSLC